MNEVKKAGPQKYQKTDPPDCSEAFFYMAQDRMSMRIKGRSFQRGQEHKPDEQHPTNPGHGRDEVDPKDQGWKHGGLVSRFRKGSHRIIRVNRAVPEIRNLFFY